ncbi:MAG: nucleotidyl transferase AbiEii/AbiGii toxin family protein [Treponema sp.]|jgi:predicted nucleotidyltransferase component of viral defense system|nr:nucleotidyl transferase AbiEii/AbiGii toxin family protein [Treponema sp.]
MILPSQYYEESLYPLQNGVLNAINSYGTHFFLTGGTALSRAYYHHRYSDDLDFFVTSDPEYKKQVDMIIARLSADGFFPETKSEIVRDVSYTSFKVGWQKSETLLKLDFVNDLVPHFGEIQKTPLFDRTDSIRNILSNKLTALFRYAGKDVADIREIALHEKIDWPLIIREAREKEMGIEIPIVCEILKGMPRQEFEGINWVQKPGWQVFCDDIDRLVFDLMNCTKKGN